MGEIPFNSPKAVCTASQLRSKMEMKMRKFCGVNVIIGPLDKYIEEAYQKGCYNDDVRKQLYDIQKYCDTVLLTSDYQELPKFDQIVVWSKIVDEL